MLYIHIGGLGELVRLVRPPVTGRSASFRLRFRFVRAVRVGRAGEARRGEAAWPSVCRPLSYRWAFLELGSTRLPSSRRRYFQRRRIGFNEMCTCFGALCWFVDANSMGFKILKKMHAVTCMGFKRYPLKTHANSKWTLKNPCTCFSLSLPFSLSLFLSLSFAGSLIQISWVLRSWCMCMLWFACVFKRSPLKTLQISDKYWGVF